MGHAHRSVIDIAIKDEKFSTITFIQRNNGGSRIEFHSDTDHILNPELTLCGD